MGGWRQKKNPAYCNTSPKFIVRAVWVVHNYWWTHIRRFAILSYPVCKYGWRPSWFAWPASVFLPEDFAQSGAWIYSVHSAQTDNSAFSTYRSGTEAIRSNFKFSQTWRHLCYTRSAAPPDNACSPKASGIIISCGCRHLKGYAGQADWYAR